MDYYDVKRYGLLLAVQCEIEGMKAQNNAWMKDKGCNAWGEEHFDQKAEELRNITFAHNEQL